MRENWHEENGGGDGPIIAIPCTKRGSGHGQILGCVRDSNTESKAAIPN